MHALPILSSNFHITLLELSEKPRQNGIMTATLQSVFEALGYTEPQQQIALIKLLQASGAFGPLLVNGILSDQQAQAVLEKLTFDNSAQAATWLHDATQEHLLRPKGLERYETVELPVYQQHHEELAQALRQTGMLSEMETTHTPYKHVLLLGGMEKDFDARLDTLKHAWERGVRFSDISFLGCGRALAPEFEPSANRIGPRGAPIANEMDMMIARYYAKSADWPKDMREQVRIFDVDTFNHSDGTRPTTKETIESWNKIQPSPGKVLVVSNQPYARYQDAAVKSVLPKHFEVETIGEPIDNASVKISVALDALARQIDVGFENLMAHMQANPHSHAVPLMGVDPASLKIDAPTYQFRSGADANGVTPEYRYKSTYWDPIIHGDPILVHERLDGTMYVADGHHRVDLAKRLNAEGNGPGNILAMVLSEKQGYSAEDARVVAAYRNIARGQVSLMDTTRVFKEVRSGRVHNELLPELPANDDVQLAIKLSQISDPSLKKVENGEVPAVIAVQINEQLHGNTPQVDWAIKIVADRLKQKFVAGQLPPIAAVGMAKTLPIVPPVSNHVDKIKGELEKPPGFYLS